MRKSIETLTKKAQEVMSALTGGNLAPGEKEKFNQLLTRITDIHFGIQNLTDIQTALAENNLSPQNGIAQAEETINRYRLLSYLPEGVKGIQMKDLPPVYRLDMNEETEGSMWTLEDLNAFKKTIFNASQGQGVRWVEGIMGSNNPNDWRIS